MEVKHEVKKGCLTSIDKSEQNIISGVYHCPKASTYMSG